MELTLFVTLGLVVFGSVRAGNQDGLYYTNGTHIFYSDNPSAGSSAIIYSQMSGRIVGLAYYDADNLLFWSDISLENKGIWKGTLDGNQIDDAQRIVESDVLEINGISVDWDAMHIYWTDGRKHSVEVADFDGDNRRILQITDLISPRGIYADPVSGYLFWNDQGTKVIGRSFLDGSEQQVMYQSSGGNEFQPNQMVVIGGNLYFADAADGSVKQIPNTSDGQQAARLVKDFGDNVLFGLTAHNEQIYASSWEGSIHSVKADGSQSGSVLSGQGDVLFSIVYAAAQTGGDASCLNKKGCSHLCLPKGSTSRCACPSYGGLVLQSDMKNCAVPNNVLFFALAGEGQVGFKNIGNDNDEDLYLVGRSLRPVAVTYDPIDQFVFWSDVHEHSIHRAKFDGSQHSIFMGYNQSIGVVDGLAIDYVDRHIYYSNMGHVTLGGVPYTWHKIEMASLNDANQRRTVIETAEKPRALFIDNINRLLFYTDWGANAAVIRTALDGSNPQKVKTALNNPNGVTLVNNKVYVVDSHYKTRDSSYPSEPIAAALYNSNTNGDNWAIMNGNWNLQTPFGLTSSPQKVFVSDWDNGNIISIPVNGGQATIEINGVNTPMGIFYSSRIASQASPSCIRSCDTGYCVEGIAKDDKCTCDSYHAEVIRDNLNCVQPNNYLVFADFNAIKMIGLDGEDQSVYTIVQGSRYFSNFVALVVKDDTVYYSEENRGGIYFAKLDMSDSGMLYDTGEDIIDGMALNEEGDRLFWTDYREGKIASVALDGEISSYRVLVTSLDKPRAIRVTSSHIYWTEWGGNPRVARSTLNGESLEIIVSDGLTFPNALYVDYDNNNLHIGDRKDNHIIKCNLDGTGCHTLDIATGKFQHIYDLIVHKETLIYTDWIRETVSLLNTRRGESIDLAIGTMRPTQMALHYPGNVVCPASHGCQDICSPYVGGYECVCNPGRTPQIDNAKLCQKAYQEWIPAMPSQCSAPCEANQGCAKKVGQNEFACKCLEGYGSSSCTACQVDNFKSGLGDGPCKPCPSESSTPNQASTQCECASNAGPWDVREETCQRQADKSGRCPKLSAPFGTIIRHCGIQCSNDDNCDGSQRCCDYNVNSTCTAHVCVDPVELSECSYNGKLYLVGQSFSPNDCIKCTCEYERVLGDPRYGNAVCETQSCPPLECSTKDQIKESGACCKKCKEDNACGINNCPLSEIDVNLEENRNTYPYKFEPYTSDESAVFSPKGVQYLKWQDNAHILRYTSTCGKSSDDCTITVKVNDNYDPTISCPYDQILYTAESATKAIWNPVISQDQGSGIAAGYPQSNLKYNSDVAIGTHPVYYTTKDRAGNENKCDFMLIVKKQVVTTCSIPSVIYGNLHCNENPQISEIRCELKCSQDHSGSNATTYICTDGSWSPMKPDKYFSCIRKSQPIVFGLIVAYNDKCIDSADIYIAEDLVSQHVLARYLSDNRKFVVSAKLIDCTNDKHTVNIVVSSVESGTDENWNPQNLISELNDILNAITKTIQGGAFTVTGVGTLTFGSGGEARKGCAPGTIPSGNFCDWCPIGTYNNLERGTCDKCGAGTYQDGEGRTACKVCPGRGSSAEGASNVEECESPPSESSKLTVIIAVVVVVVVLIVVAAIVIVVVIKKRQGDKPQRNGTNGWHHSNQAYEGGEDNQYDEVNTADLKSNQLYTNGNAEHGYETPSFEKPKEESQYTELA